MNHLDTPVALDSRELERLLYIIDASIKISKRFEFFLWTQGALQALLPHETLICVFGELDSQRFSAEVFSRTVVKPELEKALRDNEDGLAAIMLRDWIAAGRVPRLHGCEDLPAAAGRTMENRGLLASLRGFGFSNAVCHGPHASRGDRCSFFAALQLPGSPCPRYAYLLELLLPHLHMTLQRVLDIEQQAAPDAALQAALSSREIQVLQWVGLGKSNFEIGQILNISPLTVKNHMQRILRKLKVSNRAQAVATSKSLRMQVIDVDGPSLTVSPLSLPASET